MSDPLYFLPWLRRGLGLTLGERDSGQRELPRAASVPVYVEVDGQRAYAALALRPADHAIAIDAAQIVRRYPQPNTADAEYGYFPLAELAAPDLPWVLSPVTADEVPRAAASTGRLRPWVVLVCVEEDAAELVPAAAGLQARLAVAVDQLPDLAESHAWAHVQSIVAPGDVVGALGGTPGTVISRLVCARRLEPSTSYRAAVVLALVPDGDELVPAWEAGSATPELTVYNTWTFTTGTTSSFEELCRRLGPVPAGAQLRLGLHRMDVTDLGSVDAWPRRVKRVLVDYSGALCDSDVSPSVLGPLKDDFEAAVTPLLDQASARPVLDLDDPDPVVTPPFYGSLAALAESVPASGWLHQLNLDPNRRAAAGLGAAVVRANQERFMAEAWRQAGELREANRELSATRLQAEIGRTWKVRAQRLDDLQRVAVMRSQLGFVRDGDGQPPRKLMQDSTIPDALTSPAFLRVARPGGVVAAAAAARGGDEAPSFRSAMAASFGSASTRRAMRFGVVGIPRGTTLDDPRRKGGRWVPDGMGDALPIAPVDDLELAGVAALTTAVDPLGAARARILARVPGLKLGGAQELPTSVRWGPSIDEALSWSLSSELLLPGVEQFPQNAVRVVEGSSAFVASFLAGADHEMSRELLWREFPADLRSTTFRRFWDRPDIADCDIDPIAGWDAGTSLGTLGAAGGESVVLLIRGDLVQHYPTLRMLLIDPATREASLPSFGGWIAPDVRFAGFDVADADAVTAAGSQWEVALEEQPCEPRFGLDHGDGSEPLNAWRDLEWEQLDGQGDSVHLVLAGSGPQPAPPGATWGLNSAHMARITYQAPFRMLFLVADLVGA